MPACTRDHGCSGADFVQQPSLCETYVAVHRGLGGADGGPYLVISHSAEIMQFDDLCEARLELLQALQGFIESDDIDVDRQGEFCDIRACVVTHAAVALDPPGRLGMRHPHPSPGAQ